MIFSKKETLSEDLRPNKKVEQRSNRAICLDRRTPCGDSNLVATPRQWRAGKGARGCDRFHRLVLEKCLLEGIDSYVVFEDDAGFTSDFPDRLNQFVAKRPSDWGLADFGGQHLHAATRPPRG